MALSVGTDDIFLTEKILRRVQNVLCDAADKWFDIGIQLSIPIRALRDIQGKYRDQSEALREMLIFCCTQQKVKLKDLIDSLHQPAVNLHVCAKSLDGLQEELLQGELVIIV